MATSKIIEANVFLIKLPFLFVIGKLDIYKLASKPFIIPFQAILFRIKGEKFLIKKEENIYKISEFHPVPLPLNPFWPKEVQQLRFCLDWIGYRIEVFNLKRWISGLVLLNPLAQLFRSPDFVKAVAFNDVDKAIGKSN